MPEGPPSTRSDAGASQRYAQAPSLHELLDGVLSDVGERTLLERMVLVAAYEGHASVSSVGIPDDDIDAFVQAVAHATRSDGPPASGDSLSDAASALKSLGAHAAIPVVTQTTGLVAGFVVEAEPHHPDVAQIRSILDLAAPFIVRAAELHGLRRKVGTIESTQFRSRRALEVLPDPVLVMDTDARIHLANRRAEELLVPTPDDSAGRRRAVETNNLFFSAFRARAILEGNGRGASGELLLVDPTDGSDLLFEVFLFPFHDADSTPDSSIVILRDITDLRHATHELEVQFSRSVAAEHEAKKKSERLNVIIENAGVPIFVTDRQTNVVLMNREAERLLTESGSGRTSPRVHDIRANDAKLTGFINDFLIHSRHRHEARLTLVDPDEAREFPALALSTKILDEHYEPTAVVTILHDLTQEVENRSLAQELRRFNTQLEARVKAATHEVAARNAQLEEQRAALERASRMKSEFLATMSHELRTPINAVLGYNSLLREGIFGELSDKQMDALHRMRKAAAHLLSVINDILDLSRVESGKIQVSVTEVDLVPFLENISESVGPQAAQKSLDFVVDIDPNTPSIQADGTRLRQVMLNLLSNAVKFTESGSVTLRAGAAEDTHGIFMEVIDTGVGIDEADMETIFDEFTQVDQSPTREYGGTGLGLAISRKLVQLMGGALYVRSEPGRGTTFRVELPIVPLLILGDTATPVDTDEATGAEG